MIGPTNQWLISSYTQQIGTFVTLYWQSSLWLVLWISLIHCTISQLITFTINWIFHIFFAFCHLCHLRLSLNVHLFIAFALSGNVCDFSRNVNTWIFTWVNTSPYMKSLSFSFTYEHMNAHEFVDSVKQDTIDLCIGYYIFKPHMSLAYKSPCFQTKNFLKSVNSTLFPFCCV